MRPSPSIVFVGFDSAWTDKPNAPGAICSITYDDGRFTGFEPPRLASFPQALAFIRSVHGAGRRSLQSTSRRSSRTPPGCGLSTDARLQF